MPAIISLLYDLMSQSERSISEHVGESSKNQAFSETRQANH